MSDRDKEFRAFHIAKLNPSRDKRETAFMKISRRGLLMRLVKECEFRDIRLASLERLNSRELRKLSTEEQAFYLKLALVDRDPQVRMTSVTRIDPNSRSSLLSSLYADVRLFLAQTTTKREDLLRLLLDKAPEVRTEAEKSLNKSSVKNTQEFSMN